jgi:uncharacterized membrane protein YgcG
VVLLVCLGLFSAAPAWAQDDEFPGLDPGRRVYDQTGSSLTAEQAGQLTARLIALRDTGADAVVLVRALDADSDDTYDQVEALQQAWAAATGTGQDTAVAILVNRNPGDPTDARAGVFVGRTYQDGNVPEKEQRAIVEDVLIPPLRSGDVNGALAAAIDRLGSSIRNGPPVGAFDRWAADQAGSWLPGTAIAVAVVALGGALLLFGRRSRFAGPTPEPTTRRPGDLSPAVVERLVTGSSTAGSLQAVVLELAARGALVIEPEDTGTKPTVRIRLRDQQRVEGPIEEAVWTGLTEQADDRVVDSKALRKLAGHTAPISSAVRRRLLDEGWLDTGSGRIRIWLAVIGALTLLAGVFTIVVAAAAGGPVLAWIGAAALMLVAALAGGLAAVYPALSAAGLKVAAPWKAYRAGLAGAAKDRSTELDLDRTLPDVVALGLAPTMKDRLEEATESRGLSAFGPTTAQTVGFPLWSAFIDGTAAAAGSSTGTVSGAGAGGGGGAAGST